MTLVNILHSDDKREIGLWDPHSFGSLPGFSKTMTKARSNVLGNWSISIVV